jgi:hypothetical protein
MSTLFTGKGTLALTTGEVSVFVRSLPDMASPDTKFIMHQLLTGPRGRTAKVTKVQTSTRFPTSLQQAATFARKIAVRY